MDKSQASVAVLSGWERRAAKAIEAHYLSARFFDLRGKRLGIPTVAITTVIGTSIFASLAGFQNRYVQFAAGLLSLTAAVLAALQTTLGYAERSEKHRTSAARYAAIRRHIEQVCASGQAGSETMAAIRTRIDNASEEAPSIPQRFWSQVQEKFGGGSYTGGTD